VTLPIAGWYPDPQGSTRSRWWDGARWGELAPEPAMSPSVPQTPSWTHVAPAAAGPRFSAAAVADVAPRPPAPSAVGMRSRNDTARPLRGRKKWAADERAARAVNPIAYTGLLFAVIAAFFDPFAVFSVLAIVFGAIGLGRAGALQGARHTGFGLAMCAVVIGVLETAWFWVRFADLMR
jgi:hypothetical protein